MLLKPTAGSLPRLPPQHVTILGAGLTGLTAAYHLSHALPSNSKITLIDAQSRVGGWLNSQRHTIGFIDSNGKKVEGEIVLESGPRSIRPRGSRGAPGMLRLIRDTGLLPEIIPIPSTHPSAKNRFLFDSQTNGLTKLPSSLLSMLKPQPPLLKGLLPSALTEPFKVKRRGTDNDETLDSFIRRRLGPKIADNMISAMGHGIYAASSTVLSVRSTFGIMWDAESHYGSLVLGMLLGTKNRAEKAAEKADWEALGELGKEREAWSLYGFKGGLATLSKGIEAKVRSRGVEIRTGTKVQSLHPEENGVRIRTADSATSSSHIVSTLPPSILDSLLPSSHPLPHLTANPSTSVAVVNLVYPLPPSAVHPPGFGYLVPRSTDGTNPAGILGVVFDSTALPGVDGLENQVTKLTVMLGGPYWSDYPSSPTDASPLAIPSKSELVALAKDHVQRTFPVLKTLDPILTVPHLHRSAIPTYLPHHGDRLRELHGKIVEGPWRGKLSVAGNGYGGVGVNDCVYMAEEVAAALSAGRVVSGLERWANWE